MHRPVSAQPTPNERRATHVLAAGLGLILAVTLGACGRPATNPVDPEALAAPARPDPDTLLSVMLAPSGPDAVENALRGLPEPLSVTSRTVVGVHGNVAEISELRYEGLEVTTYDLGGGQRTLLVALELTAGSMRNHDLAIGMDAARALSRFADARSLPAATGASASFSVEDEPLSAPYQVDLTFAAGRLSAVAWHAYLD